MNIIAFVVFVIGLPMVITALSLLISIRKNFLVGMSYRIEFLDKIESVRFGKMLKKHNISPQDLLHSERIANIEKQLSNCLNCGSTVECDRVLKKPVIADQDLAFCPNH